MLEAKVTRARRGELAWEWRVLLFSLKCYIMTNWVLFPNS